MRSFAIKSIGVASAIVIAQTALAQEEDTEKVLESIVVTGTHIKNSQGLGASQVLSYDRQEFEATGVTSLSDLVRYIPAQAGSDINADISDPALAGTAQFNLRGLGFGSTLVLINGRRQVLAGPVSLDGQSFVDVNSIPLSAIGRVDVLKDGAGAIYGSDAVAGVVNLVTRRDVDGLELALSTETASGDSQANEISISYGKEWSWGQTALFSSAFDQSELRMVDRDFTSGTGITPLGNPGTYVPLGGDQAGQFVRDAACGEANSIPVGPFCGFDFIPFLQLVPEQKRYNVLGTLDFQVNGSTRGYVEAAFAKNETERTRVPALPVAGIAIPATHPENPFGAPALWFGRVRPNISDASRDPFDSETYRLVVGFEGEISENWDWNADYVYARNDFLFATEDAVLSTLNTRLGDGTYNPFGTALTNSAVANSEALLDEILGLHSQDFTSILNVFDLTFTGELFDLKGGAANIALGYQRRSEDFEVDFDDVYNATDFAVIAGGPDADADRTTHAGFVELVLPVTESIEVQLAGRYEDYQGDIGDSFDPKLAAKWQITDDVALRGSWSTAFRAPTLYQTNATQVGFSQVVDPVVGSAVFRPILTVGNPELGSEESDNVSFGIVLEPTSDIRATVDYWKIDYENVIIKESFQDVVFSDPLDSKVIRDPVSGQIIRVEVDFVNASSIASEGFDLEFSWKRETNYGEFTSGLTGTYVSKYDLTLGDGEEEIDGAGQRNATNFARSMPELRMNFQLGWSYGPNTVSGLVRHISDYDDDLNLNTIDSQTTLDIQYSRVFENLLSGGGQTQLSIGAINLFDQDPPNVGPDAIGGFDTKIHDPRGRIVYLKLKQSF